MSKVRVIEDRTFVHYHTELSRESILDAKTAITPGAPERAKLIAQYLDEPRLAAEHRGLAGWVGLLNGVPVVVQSTGMGGPSTEIVQQELMQLGVENFLRIGTCGSIQPDVPVGTLIVTEAAVRLDGTSDHYAPPMFPAAADIELTWALREAARAAGVVWRSGITASSATFYPGQERYDSATGYVPQSRQGSLKEWQALGVLNFEMEAAALFTIARSAGLRAGCICGAIAHRTASESVHRDVIRKAEEDCAQVAMEALKSFHKRIGV